MKPTGSYSSLPRVYYRALAYAGCSRLAGCVTPRLPRPPDASKRLPVRPPLAVSHPETNHTKGMGTQEKSLLQRQRSHCLQGSPHTLRKLLRRRRGLHKEGRDLKMIQYTQGKRTGWRWARESRGPQNWRPGAAAARWGMGAPGRGRRCCAEHPGSTLLAGGPASGSAASRARSPSLASEDREEEKSLWQL